MSRKNFFLGIHWHTYAENIFTIESYGFLLLPGTKLELYDFGEVSLNKISYGHGAKLSTRFIDEGLHFRSWTTSASVRSELWDELSLFLNIFNWRATLALSPIIKRLVHISRDSGSLTDIFPRYTYKMRKWHCIFHWNQFSRRRVILKQIDKCDYYDSNVLWYDTKTSLLALIIIVIIHTQQHKQDKPK